MNNEQIVTSVKKLRNFDEVDDNRKLIETSALLRLGKLDKIDVDWLEDQVLAMAKSEQRECKSCLTELLLHLLKWKYQPDRRGSSWEVSINKQRAALDDLLGSKTLYNFLINQLPSRYTLAVKNAIAETGLKKSIFPTHCEWDFEQILDDEFFPE